MTRITLTAERLSLPAQDGAAPGEPRAEGCEGHDLPGREYAVALGFGEKHGDGGGRAVPKAFDIAEGAIRGDLQFLGDVFVDAEIRLVEEKEINIVNLDAGVRQGFL